MKLAPIEPRHLIEASDQMDELAKFPWTEYWITIPQKEKIYPYKDLVRRAYQLATGEEMPKTIQSNKSYRSYIQRQFGMPITFRIRDNLTFFTQADMGYFHTYAGKKFRPDSRAHQAVGKHLGTLFFTKVDAWSRAIELEGFSASMKHTWQLRGQIFARYAWARIYRPRNMDLPVYFTVEANGDEQCLKFKLDYQYTGEKQLTDQQVSVFDRIVDDTYARDGRIEATEFQHYSWERLINESHAFIERYIDLYDEVIAELRSATTDRLSKKGLKGKPVPSKPLTLQPLPTGLINPPDWRPPAAGSNADYDAESKQRTTLGFKGEELVLAMEQRDLEEAGFHELAKRVKKVKDWNGFDIHSFFPDGKDKYIEVKTTTGGANRHFYWSRNERQKMIDHSGTYFLYRLYNYDVDAGTADYFILDGNIIDSVHEVPVQYTVYIRARPSK